MKKPGIRSGTLSLLFRSTFCFLLMSGSIPVLSQVAIDSMISPGGEFAMYVSRINNEILITISFSDSTVFDYISIERKADFENSFGQCVYIPYDELKGKRTITKKDKYPFPGNSDVSYRLRLVSRDGPMRLYPPVKLPAVAK